MFSKKTVAFLKELSNNNRRDWFEQNKARYEAEVRAPALEYVEQMAAPLHRISPHFTAVAKKSGGSLMRVYKDTRFSKDKTPYKTNIGIQFRHERGRDVHAPGFYLHIEPGEVFLGAGVWRPESSTLSSMRMMIDENQADWKKLRKKFGGKNALDLSGDSLKRPPKGYQADHPLIDDLKRKDYIAICNLKVSTVYSKDFVKETARLFKAASPLVQFICEADDLSF